MLILHKPKCENNNITTLRTSSESYIQWKKHFHENPLCFRNYAGFEADNEKDNSSIGNETTNIYEQNPILNGYHIESQLEDVLRNGYYRSPLGHNNVDWFVDEINILEKKRAFYFKNTIKDIIMTEEIEQDFEIINFCRFCDENIGSDKVRALCPLTRKYRGVAHSNCNFKVTQKQTFFIPFIFHNFGNYDCHMFFEKLVDKKKNKVKFDVIPQTNEEYIPVTYGCVGFIDSYRFLSSSLDSLVKTLVDNSHKTLKNLKEEIVENKETLNIINEILEENKSIKDLKKDYPEEI